MASAGRSSGCPGICAHVPQRVEDDEATHAQVMTPPVIKE